jgi:uncharacterized protein
MIWTAFMLGLVGSLHCVGMCGAIALALPHPGRGWTSFITGRLAYNVGRILTYAVIGAVFGLIGRSLALAGIQRWLSIGAGIAILLGLFLSNRLTTPPIVRAVGWLKARLGTLLQQRSLSSLLLLGMLNGLLPCGLVYAAAAASLATGKILSGVGYMAAFGLGTVPLMFGVSLTGRSLLAPFRLHLQKLIPASLAVVGLLLILRGMSLGIPFVSPDLGAGQAACCSSP